MSYDYAAALERHLDGLRTQLEHAYTDERVETAGLFLAGLSSDTLGYVCDALNAEHERWTGEYYVYWDERAPEVREETLLWTLLLVSAVARLEAEEQEFDRAYAEYIDLDVSD